MLFKQLDHMISNFIEFKTEDVSSNLEMIKILTFSFSELIEIVPHYKVRQIIVSAFKYAKTFIEMFVKLLLPILSGNIRNNIEMVNDILKCLQKATRIIQVRMY